MKTYVLIVSKRFPKKHKRAGESTEFIDKIACSLFCPGDCASCHYNRETFKKIHTIRANYPLWEKRVKEVNEGKARLSIRYWSGKPYNSMQIEIHQLTEDSGIGVQKIEFQGANGQNITHWPIIDGIQGSAQFGFIAENDGLSLDDFSAWFKGYDLSKPMAIIWFCNQRY